MQLTDLVFALTELKNAESSLINNFNSDEIKHDIESLDNRIITLLKEWAEQAASIHDSCVLLSSAFATRIFCRICLGSNPLALAMALILSGLKLAFGINVNYPVDRRRHHTQSIADLRFSTARSSINLCNDACLDPTVQ